MAIKAAPPPAQPSRAVQDVYEPAKNLLCDQLGLELVTLTIGTPDDALKIIVHKKILCEKIGYFKKMFNGGFSEAMTQEATLPEDDPLPFKLLIGWMYSGVIATGPDPVNALIKLFGLAEKYLITELADKTMEHLTGLCKAKRRLLHPSQIRLAYQVTHKDSKLRIFAARTYVYATLHFDDSHADGTWSTEKMFGAITGYDDLWRDAFSMMRLQAGKLRVNPREEHICDYHQHAKADPCPYTKK